MSSVRPRPGPKLASGVVITDSKVDLVSMEISEKAGGGGRKAGGGGGGLRSSGGGTPSSLETTSCSDNESGGGGGGLWGQGHGGPRTRLEKLLMLTLALFGLALMIVLGVAVSRILMQEEAERKWNRLCNTPGCVQAAQSIIQNMDHTAQPCQDFYQYACGGFEDRVSTKAFSEIRALSSWLLAITTA